MSSGTGARPRNHPKLEHVKWTWKVNKTGGRWYAYFNTGKLVNGKPVWAALPPHSSAGFFDSYAAMMGARTKRGQQVYTVADLCRAYELSKSFKGLALNTQKVYIHTFKRVIEQLGKFPIDKVERRHIREVIDNRLPGSGSKNIFRAVMGVLYRYANAQDLTDRNPARGLPLIKGTPHEEWPDELLAAALACDDDRIRLAVHLLYYTGQRIGDVLAMRWADLNNGRIAVVQQKTQKALLIPVTRQLEAELAKAPRYGATILAQENGKPVSHSRIREQIKLFAMKLGFDVVPHGLRKNAVITLLQAGCTIAEVGAITGQTYAIVEHYAKGVDQWKLGSAAMAKWGETSQIK